MCSRNSHGFVVFRLNTESKLPAKNTDSLLFMSIITFTGKKRKMFFHSTSGKSNR